MKIMKVKFYANRARNIKITVTAAICFVAVIVAFFTNSKSLEKLGFSASDFDTERDFIRIIDVGQAESILVYSNGYSMLFDVGTEAATDEICDCLDGFGIKTVDVVMISHLHDDHIGGIEEIAENYRVENLILPEISIESDALTKAEAAIKLVTDSGGDTYNAQRGMNFEIGEFTVTVLAEYSDNNENNRCIIAKAETSGKSFLFTGDAETKIEKRLISEGIELKADILSVGHHGSSTSSSEEFLKAVSPSYAAISVGEGNTYGHPHNTVLAALENTGARVFRTDLCGSITFEFKNGYITAKTEKAVG